MATETVEPKESSIVDELENLPEPVEQEVEIEFSDEDIESKSLDELFKPKPEVEQEPEAKPESEPEKKTEDEPPKEPEKEAEEPEVEQKPEDKSSQYTEHEQKLYGQMKKHKDKSAELADQVSQLQQQLNAKLIANQQSTEEPIEQDELPDDEFLTASQLGPAIEKIIGQKQQIISQQREQTIEQAGQIGKAFYDDFNDVVSPEAIKAIESNPQESQLVMSHTDPIKMAKAVYEMCKSKIEAPAVEQPGPPVEQPIPKTKIPANKPPVNPDVIKKLRPDQLEWLSKKIGNANSDEEINRIMSQVNGAYQ